MTPRKPPSPARSSESPQDDLQQSVAELAQLVRSLTDVMERVREELSWLARNGMPHQPLSLQVFAKGHAIQEHAKSSDQPDAPTDEPISSPVTSKELEQACDWLADNIAGLLEEQLGMILESQDGLKKQLLQAIARELSGKTRPRTESQLPPNQTGEKVNLPPLPSSHPASAVAQQRSSPRAWEPGEAVEFTIDGREVWGEIVALNEAGNSATVLLIPSEEEVTVSPDLLRPEYGSLRDRQPLSPTRSDETSLPASDPRKSSTGRLF